MKKRVYVVIGPTASGKTSYAVRLAKHLGGEVISADSMQIYRTMDIGTATPTPAETEGVPHHLLSFVDPTENFSVAQFREKALPLLDSIPVPIVCGGSGLWVKSLFSGFSEAPVGDPALRARLEEEAKNHAPDYLYTLLTRIDPEAAARLHPNDKKRIIRALEIKELTGKSILAYEQASKDEDSPFSPYYILMLHDRDVLYERIDKRVELMVKNGLLEEAKKILDTVPLTATSMQGIGYKEWTPYFKGSATQSECTEILKQNTRRYAKRQLTWFRRIPVCEIVT